VERCLTFFAGGALSSPSAPSAGASSSAFRFFPLVDFGFSSLSALVSLVVSFSAFFERGFAGAFFTTTGSGFGCSLILDERRGSPPSVAPSVEAVALRGIWVDKEKKRVNEIRQGMRPKMRVRTEETRPSVEWIQQCSSVDFPIT